MDDEVLARVQQRVSAARTPWLDQLHRFPGVDPAFRPWECGLSPSALYNCSLGCRKAMRLKTPEVKWMSVKRWVSVTPEGVILPPGVYLSVKRKEEFMAFPTPHFDKKEFTLMMFPYGNVWSQQSPDVPITERWLWSEVDNMLLFEALLRRDAAKPVVGYFSACDRFARENPEQIGIHMKRKKR
jgi:hypothetical protein